MMKKALAILCALLFALAAFTACNPKEIGPPSLSVLTLAEFEADTGEITGRVENAPKDTVVCAYRYAQPSGYDGWKLDVDDMPSFTLGEEGEFSIPMDSRVDGLSGELKLYLMNKEDVVSALMDLKKALANGSVEYVFAVRLVTVAYEANAGEGAPESQSAVAGELVTLSQGDGLSKEGFAFRGWSTGKDGAVDYQPGGSYPFDEDVTLYAVWEEGRVTVSYDANGGSSAPGSQSEPAGTAIKLSSVKPTRSGYIFQGWAASKGGAVKYQPGDSYSGASVTLYALWIPDITVPPTKLYVYKDYMSGDNHYEDAALMPDDDGSVTMNFNSRSNPVSGTCMEFSYTPYGTHWAGVAMLSGADNWKGPPVRGIDLSKTKAAKLNFSARGTGGGAKFFVEDMNGRQATTYVNFTSGWKQYSIDVSNLSGPISVGFAWAANQTDAGNKKMTFYIDEVYYS